MLRKVVAEFRAEDKLRPLHSGTDHDELEAVAHLSVVAGAPLMAQETRYPGAAVSKSQQLEGDVVAEVGPIVALGADADRVPAQGLRMIRRIEEVRQWEVVHSEANQDRKAQRQAVALRPLQPGGVHCEW